MSRRGTSPSRWALGAAVGLGVLQGCEAADLEVLSLPPELGTLPVLTTLQSSDSFGASGVAGTEDCEILLVAGEWGTVLRLGKDGQLAARPRRIPGGPRSARIERPVDGHSLISSRNPPRLSVIRVRDLSTRELTIPPHPRGEQRIGPVALLNPGRIALSSVGEPSRPWRRPDPWRDAPLVQVFDSASGLVNGVGSVDLSDGSYLTWLGARVSIGGSGDTIRVVFLSDARLETYLTYQEGGGPSLVSSVQLPRYFTAPTPREAVSSPAWIQVNGESVVFSEVSHLASAHVGLGGKLYVIRNYAADPVSFSHPTLGNLRGWSVTQQALEIYGPEGRLLGAFALPEKTFVTWLRVDDVGRIYFPAEGGSVVVAADPTAPAGRCPQLPRSIPIPVADRPPPPDSLRGVAWE